jgi:nucleotide-binding universal stress UspA family protein
MVGCIVCGIDDSDGARRAAHVADDLACDLRARVVLVHAAPLARSMMYGTPVDPETLQDQTLEDARRLLDDLERGCRAENVTRRVEHGLPVDVLMRVLRDEHADLLVMGTRGAGPLRSALVGSVAQQMIAISPCPVVVVPPKAYGPTG